MYDDTHEALNRDSCIFTAREFVSSIEQDQQKQFVFLSASETIGPLLEKYSQMKRQAEDYLIYDEDCEQKLNPVILRPGLVWHQNERQWSLPLKLATDFGYFLNK